jgi:hypothetical protein
MGNILAAFAAYETKVRAEGTLAGPLATRISGVRWEGLPFWAVAPPNSVPNTFNASSTQNR